MLNWSRPSYDQSPHSMSVDGTSSETRLSTVNPFTMPPAGTTKRPLPAQHLSSRNLYLGWPLSKAWMVAERRSVPFDNGESNTHCWTRTGSFWPLASTRRFFQFLHSSKRRQYTRKRWEFPQRPYTRLGVVGWKRA